MERGWVLKRGSPLPKPPVPREHMAGKRWQELAGGPGEGGGRLGSRAVSPHCSGPLAVTIQFCFRNQSLSSLPPQAPGRATTPTARALSTSASGTSCSAASGAPRTRPGSGSGPGQPRPASWAPTTCAKVGGLQQGQVARPRPSFSRPAAALLLITGRQVDRRVWSMKEGFPSQIEQLLP